MRTFPTVRGGVLIAVGVLAVATLSGCVASPKTTYTTESGETVTVDWANYPGHADIDAEAILAAPSAEELDAYAVDLLGAIEEQLTAQFDLRWEDDPGFGPLVTPFDENGYGGGSLYAGYDSVMRLSTTVPNDPQDWYRLVDIVSAVAKSYGLGDVVIDNFNPEMPEEHAEAFGTADPDEQWNWQGGARSEHEFLYVGITDVRRDASGEAARQGGRGVMRPQFIAISYSAAALPDAHREEFIERLRPFRGLERPDATHSD
jgi:hypothetical protein